MPHNECSWFNGVKFRSELWKFLDERVITGNYETDCENDAMEFYVEFIQCVRLEEIKKAEAWAPQRVEALEEWATPDTLNRIKYFHPEKMDNLSCMDIFQNPPRMGREYHLVLPPDKQDKYGISDGIHRTDRARKLGMDCIMAQVGEWVTIKKEDVNQYDPMAR